MFIIFKHPITDMDDHDLKIPRHYFLKRLNFVSCRESGDHCSMIRLVGSIVLNFWITFKSSSWQETGQKIRYFPLSPRKNANNQHAGSSFDSMWDLSDALLISSIFSKSSVYNSFSLSLSTWWLPVYLLKYFKIPLFFNAFAQWSITSWSWRTLFLWLFSYRNVSLLESFFFYGSFCDSFLMEWRFLSICVIFQLGLWCESSWSGNFSPQFESCFVSYSILN